MKNILPSRVITYLSLVVCLFGSAHWPAISQWGKLDARASDALTIGIGPVVDGWQTESDEAMRLDWLDEGLSAAGARSLMVAVNCVSGTQMEAFTLGTPYEGSPQPTSAAYIRREGGKTLSARRYMRNAASSRDSFGGETATELLARTPRCGQSRLNAQVPELNGVRTRLHSLHQEQLTTMPLLLASQSFELKPNAKSYGLRGWTSTQSVADSADLSMRFGTLVGYLGVRGLVPVQTMERFAKQGTGWDYSMRHWTYAVEEGTYLSITMLRKPSPGWTKSGGQIVLGVSEK